MIRRVLVGVDFRQPSLAAARWATTHLGDVSVELAHVVRRPEVPPFLRGLADPVTVRESLSEANASRALHGLAGTLPGRSVSLRTLEGALHQALAARAAEMGADLVVLGRDRVDAARGRTLERIARTVNVPVLAIGPGSAAAPRRVVAALDDAPLRSGILRCAGRLARLFDAELILLHVLPEGLGIQVQRLTHAWLAGAHRANGGDRERMRTSVVEGLTGPSILAEAGEPTDVVVIGSHGAESAGPGGLGSTTRLVLGAAPGAVLVVPGAEAWRPSLNLLTEEPSKRSPAEPLSVA